MPNVHSLDILPETIGSSCVESNSDTQQEESCVSRLLGVAGQNDSWSKRQASGELGLPTRRKAPVASRHFVLSVELVVSSQ